jgi:zinc protease
MNGFSNTKLNNGLEIIHKELKGTNIITSNIVYKVGSRDEIPGETGIAHMLEHMVFKPTENDLKLGIDSSAMQFERETGCILNANTWKTRTAYYFCFPKQYIDKALSIEADRMNNVVLSDNEFLPERTNVLSEFDMYNGNPKFALAVEMISTALHSHPHGHETIGYREDIEDYTAEKLNSFYKKFYRPDNATITIVGDISKSNAIKVVKKHFEQLSNPPSQIVRIKAREPKQEGLKRVSIERPSSTNILAIGFKHAGFPSKDWYIASSAIDLLVNGDDSILHKALIDTGIAADLSYDFEPTDDMNLGILFVTLTKWQRHDEVENKIFEIINKIKLSQIKEKLNNQIVQAITEEKYSRESSLGITRELTEFIAANDWKAYFKTEESLRNINATEVLNFFDSAFKKQNLTIGNFIGLV